MSRKATAARLQEQGFTFTYQVIPADPGQPISTGETLIPESATDPDGYFEEAAEKHLDDGRAQRIEYVEDGFIKGMYVDDLAQIKDLPRNERATALFRAHYLAANRFINPESLPFIAGPAVLFD